MNKNVQLKLLLLSNVQKSNIIINISGNTNLFLDLKQYPSLEHAETKKFNFLLRYVFSLGKLTVWFLQLSLWSKNLALNLK